MKKIALLIPCLNEEITIIQVIKDFKEQFSNLDIYVIDNGSSDDTAILSSSVGAKIISEPKKGKGNAVRRGFADIMADIYILVDGDGTYDAASANRMVKLLINEHLDMVVGCRAYEDKASYRKGHKFGNMFFNYFSYALPYKPTVVISSIVWIKGFWIAHGLLISGCKQDHSFHNVSHYCTIFVVHHFIRIVNISHLLASIVSGDGFNNSQHS